MWAFPTNIFLSSMLDVLWVLAAGQILIYLLMELPPAKRLGQQREQVGVVGYFGGLFSCSLCLGVWLYFALCCFYHVTLGPYVPMVSEAVTAGLFSYVMHVLTLGVKLRHNVPFDVE